eukprot:TRINITY_DN2135_c0_g1_i9.p1 TRINITY_DN2135_c0_g1~~TRINITY_DN2135_c0_g1_i9.p1  ORF type:complete len:340 (-),score=36.72 TRINITY_DN2135_c0_g1_i9:314-1333(-)
MVGVCFLLSMQQQYHLFKSQQWYIQQPSLLQQKYKLGTKRLLVQVQAKTDHIFKLPIFEGRRMVHPTDRGQIVAFEPKYVQLFQEADKKLRYNKEEKSEKETQFLHILSAQNCPPAFLEDAVDNLPRIGVCCQILQIVNNDDDTLTVQYEAKRRIYLVGVLPPEEIRLYKEALVEWYDDEEAEVDDILPLEQELHSCLQEVQRINQKLQKEQVQLPPNFVRYSPPPTSTSPRSFSRVLQKGGVVAGVNIETWLRSGSKQQKFKPAAIDPYQILRDSVNRTMRQELFSFACASILEVGPIERIALAQSRDTAARLEWILKAVKPYLETLRTQYKLEQTLK